MGPKPNPSLLVRFYAREIYTCSSFSCGVDFALKDMSILLGLFNNFERFESGRLQEGSFSCGRSVFLKF